MGTIFEKLSSDALTLRGRIAERIRQAMLNGSLKAGERIVERRLAGQFGASLAVIREAIIQLEGEGFISKWPNSSTYVTKLSLEDTEKIFACRKVFEGFAVEEAARLATSEDSTVLKKLFLDLVDAARSQNSKVYIGKDLLLHEKIWQITHNEYLQGALKRIIRPLFAFHSIRVASHKSFDLLQDANLHLPLLNAIKAKNPLAARVALQAAIAEWHAQARDHVGEGSD